MNTGTGGQRRCVGRHSSRCCGVRCRYYTRRGRSTNAALSGHPRALDRDTALAIIYVVLVADVPALRAVLNTGTGVQRRCVGRHSIRCYGVRCRYCTRREGRCGASLPGDPHALARYAALAIIHVVLVADVPALRGVLNPGASWQSLSLHPSTSKQHDKGQKNTWY